MTNTATTLTLKNSEEQEIRTEKVSACDIALEAEGIGAITDLIYYSWEDRRPSEEDAMKLHSALYGLKTLIEAHADHAEQLYETHQYEV